MLGYFIWGTLAAFGVLCALWAMLGWLLPGAKGCILVCYGVPDSEILTRSKWLKSLGLLAAVATNSNVTTENLNTFPIFFPMSD